MKIKVWGCRGSLATPGPDTLRYGGNTTCLEIRGNNGSVIVVDAGSGLRKLGKALVREKNLQQIFMVFTHSHWDHLVGFPFFAPAYFKRFTITLCGGPRAQNSIKKYLSRQMKAPFFPVDFSVMKARFRFGTACPHSGHLGAIQIAAIPLNHPNGGYGFKFSEAGKSLVFIPDNELEVHHKGGPGREQFAEFCRGVDVLLHDAQYTEREYLRTRGWGHSTFASATDLAVAAGVKHFGLFHHDPDRTDDDLDRQLKFCQERIRRAHSKVKCFAVAEGMVIHL